MLSSILVFLIVLSIIVLVHELGHYFMARRAGVWVEEFGLGLPPRIWGKKIGETIYSVNALPFGGVVKIHGENQSEDIVSDRSFSSLFVWKRMVVVAAGVLMNFLFGWLVIVAILSIGVPQSVVITEIFKGTPAVTAGLEVGDVFL